MRLLALVCLLSIQTLLTTPSIALADTLDPDKLLDVVDVCNTAENALGSGIAGPQRWLEAGGCFGFIHGFIMTHGYQHGGSLSTGKGGFCAPSFKITDLIYVFNAYVRRNPRLRVVARDNPVPVLVSALQEAWPCRNR